MELGLDSDIIHELEPVSKIDNKVKKDKEKTSQKKQHNVPQDANIIPIKFRPESFAILSFIYPLTVSSICLCLYIMEGRYSGYIPTISQTGTEYPNHVIFGQAMSTGALTTSLTLYVYKCFYEMKYGISPCFSATLDILIYCAIFGICGIGLYPNNEYPYEHMFWAATGFVAIVIFELLCHIKEPSRGCISYIRGVFLAFAIAGMFIFAFHYDISVNAIGEWTLLFFILAIMVTWRRDLNSVQMYVTLLDNPDDVLTTKTDIDQQSDTLIDQYNGILEP